MISRTILDFNPVVIVFSAKEDGQHQNIDVHSYDTHTQALGSAMRFLNQKNVSSVVLETMDGTEVFSNI